MNTERLNSWLALLANVGVLVGIVFLAVEVRQSNRIAVATTEISIRGQFQALNELVISSDAVAELLAKATDADAEFSAVETERAYAYLYANLNIWGSIDHANENGMASDSTLEIAMFEISVFLQDYPAFHPIAQEVMAVIPANADTRVYDALNEALSDIQ